MSFMSNFEFYPESISQSGGVFDALQRVSGDRKATIEVLVQERQKLTKSINEKHKGKIKLFLENMTYSQTDLFGWVLFVRQQFIKEEWGFTADDPFLSLVARIEISELAINDGKPKMLLREWLDDQDNIVSERSGFGCSLAIEPTELVLYLQSILNYGNARPRIKT